MSRRSDAWSRTAAALQRSSTHVEHPRGSRPLRCCHGTRAADRHVRRREDDGPRRASSPGTPDGGHRLRRVDVAGRHVGRASHGSAPRLGSGRRRLGHGGEPGPLLRPVRARRPAQRADPGAGRAREQDGRPTRTAGPRSNAPRSSGTSTPSNRCCGTERPSSSTVGALRPSSPTSSRSSSTRRSERRRPGGSAREEPARRTTTPGATREWLRTRHRRVHTPTRERYDSTGRGSR